MKIPYSLTDEEIEIMLRGREEPNVFAGYFFRPYGSEHGWMFDDNFAEEGKWQEEVVLASQRNIVLSGGVGCGKTVGVGMGAFYFGCEVFPDFKFLNAAPFSYQATIMYNEVLKQIADTPAAKLVWKSRSKPYPKIEIRFKVAGTVINSSLEFMSVDRNAKNIFSYEGDWINLEEGGMLDDLETVIISLGSRLRGAFRGRERMGRLSIISNPWDNPYFWYLFDLAQGDPEDYLSMMLSTRHNKNVTENQLKAILKRIPVEEHERFINGARPEGRGNYFNRESVYACEDEAYGYEIELKSKDDDRYAFQKDYGVGVSYFKVPYQKGHQYMLLGDLGLDAAPNRNAPAIMCFDVSGFPENPVTMAAFWWGNGRGSIKPFIHWLLEFANIYRPFQTAVDSTSTQKYTAEILNTMLMSTNPEIINVLSDNVNLDLPKNFRIIGMDFSGAKKPSYLRAASFMLETRMFRWPKQVIGMRGQLSNYDPLKDSGQKGVVPQDLVSVLSMASFLIRRYFYNEITEEDAGENNRKNYEKAVRFKRLTNAERGRRSSVRSR